MRGDCDGPGPDAVHALDNARFVTVSQARGEALHR
jgi:hypothetical protein